MRLVRGLRQVRLGLRDANPKPAESTPLSSQHLDSLRANAIVVDRSAILTRKPTGIKPLRATDDHNLQFADFDGLDLARARITHSWLHDAHFIEANLTRAYLGKSTLASADLSGANLMNATANKTHFATGT
jgi:uncharacterized protein YjbI with pentapeptide repeats